MNNEQIASIVLAYTTVFLPAAAHHCGRLVSRRWHEVLHRLCLPVAPLTAEEAERVVHTSLLQVKSSRIGGSRVPDGLARGIRQHSGIPVAPRLRAAILQRTAEQMGETLNRNLLPPKTNVGAMDTMCTMEKVTQSRLSRFHHTGTLSNSVLQMGSLVGLMSSTQNQPAFYGNMCLYFVPGALQRDLEQALYTISGKLVETRLADYMQPKTVASFVVVGGAHTPLDPLVAAALLDTHPVCLVVLRLSATALYQNRMCPSDLARLLDQQTRPGCGRSFTTHTVAFFDRSGHPGGCWYMYIQVVRASCMVPWGGSCAANWHSTPLDEDAASNAKWPEQQRVPTAIDGAQGENFQQLHAHITHRLSRIIVFNVLMCAPSAELLQRAHAWCDGHATEDILRTVNEQLRLLVPGTYETCTQAADCCVFHVFGELAVPFTLAMSVYPQIGRLQISGVRGINAAVLVWQAASQEYAVHTSGSNLPGLMEEVLLGQQLGFVDIRRSSTSNVTDILSVLGIEAVQRMHATTCISGVNRSCIQSIIDHFLRDGNISLHRHNSVLNEITVENPQRHMVEAAVHGAVDSLTGISASVLCGTAIHSGTHGHDILFDVGAVLLGAKSE